MRAVPAFFALVALCFSCASGGVGPADGVTSSLEGGASDTSGWSDTSPANDLFSGLDQRPSDAGPTPDQALTADKGPPLPDKGPPLPDKGPPSPDKGLPSPDKGPPSPDKGPPKPDTAPTGLTAPFFLDFEQSNGGLTGTRDWEWGKLAFSAGGNCDGIPTPPPAALSGTHLWGTKLNDCFSPLGNAANTCANTNKADDSVLTLTFTLPASLKEAYLIYWEWTDYFLNYDWSEVYVQGTVARQHCTGGYIKPTNWVRRVINLKQQIGTTVTVEFHFMATTVVQDAGWYIDNLSVTDKTPP